MQPVDFDDFCPENIGDWYGFTVTFNSADQVKYSLRELVDKGRLEPVVMRQIHRKFTDLAFLTNPKVFTPVSICLVVNEFGTLIGYRVYRELTDPIASPFSEN